MGRVPHARRLYRARGAGGAPQALRRRVIASVRAEPVPLSELAHRARRHAPVSALGWAWATILLLAASGALAVVIVGASGSSSDAGAGRVSSSIPGARVALRHAGTATELSLTGMPAPPPGKTYELWLLGGHGEPRPIQDMFAVTSAGRATVALPGDLRAISEMLLTQEPIGGSATPTGPALLEVLNPSALVG